jgi:AraC-like DNA-binding protein
MFIGTASRCALCGDEVARLDEHDRCERCVLRAERIAEELLAELENLVRAARDAGLSEEQLREAFELTLGDEEGELSELSVSRQVRREGRAASWRVNPYSAWLDYEPDFLPNRIRRLRRMKALSAEALADQLGVTVSELALWEHSTEVPADVVEELAGMFGVSVPHLMKTDMDWLQG